MSKPRLAHVVLGGCEGCYVSLLDAHEALIELADAVDLVYSPLSDAREMDFADVVLVEGAVTTEHDVAALKEARAKATTLVAVGSCAALGGIGGLRNLYTADEMLTAIYGDDEACGQWTSQGDVARATHLRPGRGRHLRSGMCSEDRDAHVGAQRRLGRRALGDAATEHVRRVSAREARAAGAQFRLRVGHGLRTDGARTHRPDPLLP